jgi:hypothetical protein
VVPGGGLSADSTQWIASSPTFFLPVQVLSRVFRGKFLQGLKRLHREGKLKLENKLASLTDAKAFAQWLSPLYAKDWVVYCQPPLSPEQGPEAVLKYLARYVSGAAISDARLLAHEDGRVTFRAKNYRQGRQRETLTLSGLEFTRRFLLHVLPRGLPRVRYCGLLANTQRGRMLPLCRQLLPHTPHAATSESLPPGDDPALLERCAPDPRADEAGRCPVCRRGRLVLWEYYYPRRDVADNHPSAAVLPSCIPTRQEWMAPIFAAARALAGADTS